MSTFTQRINLILDGYVPGTSEIGKDPVTGELLYNFNSGENFESAVPLGNGIYFSAAHGFDAQVQSQRAPYPVIEFKARSASIEGNDATWHFLRDWRPQSNGNPTQSSNDLAYVVSNAEVDNELINPFIVYDSSSAYNNFMKDRSIYRYGQVSTDGPASSESVSDGEFISPISSDYGDSGGMAVTHIAGDGQGPDYVAGILSRSTDKNLSSDPVLSSFSYIRPGEFYTAIKLAENGTRNDFSSLAPDIIVGDRVGGYIRGAGRRADIITDGNNTTIVVENGGNIINTGSGLNTVVAIDPSAKNKELGTTFVVSPGDEVISGAGKNDKLVVLSDRLWSNENGKPVESTLNYISDTIKIKGGIGHKADSESWASYGPFFNYKGPEVRLHSAYDVSFSLTNNGGENSLKIYFQANDLSSELTDMGYQALWSSNITIKNFQDGDLGIHLTYDNDWGGLDSEAYQSAFAQAANTYISDPEKSDYINDNPHDNWNGVFSSPLYEGPAISDADDRIAQNEVYYLRSAVQGSLISGTNQDDVLTGSIGSDDIRGGEGVDKLIGRSGDDILSGGAGNDILDGGPGVNILIGGTGEDTALISGFSNDYEINFSVSDQDIAEFIVDLRGSDGFDSNHLRSVEHINFLDRAVDVILPRNVADFGYISNNIESASGRVYSVYEGLLGRAPTSLELEQHTAEVPNTLWLQSVINKIMATDEYKDVADALDNTKFVEFVYDRMLHRSADDDGLAYYKDRLDQGESRSEIIEEFNNSSEHKDLISDNFDSGVFVVDKNVADVARLFHVTFGRAPDESGLHYYADQLSGGTSLSEVENILYFSDEGRSNFDNISDDQFVQNIFSRADGRHATSAELDRCVNDLQSGISRSDLIIDIAESQESQHWLLSQIESGWVVT
ncbi:DUF4214 domain-containing protein [Methylobacterium organophilum]|uniref:DUF4214 domain-containing protein n=1 Tax=Methylobacterium organophilum TaxID=410 RepID=UPI001F1333A8|nr:DUF4214 domain-containing protein [Methylobacterium organophilum]UMY18191.1 DUF4214 domain-containing protein [Methylobacterium organophilum]